MSGCMGWTSAIVCGGTWERSGGDFQSGSEPEENKGVKDKV